MNKRSIAVAIALVASVVVGGEQQSAGATTVYPKCAFGIPAKLALRAPDAQASFRLGSGCPKTLLNGTWNAVLPDGTWHTSIGCSGDTQPCTFPMRWMEVGVTLHWTPENPGLGYNGRKVADLLPATSLMKCGAAIGLTGVRSGTKTTVYARASYYNTKTKSFTRHHGRVLFQKRDVGSTTWTDLGWAYPNATTGAASYTITTNRSRDYRVFVPSGKTVTHAYSATKRV
ncbi:hypothetical protein ACI2LF_31670 [Kribbella sp. NPDC020789]